MELTAATRRPALAVLEVFETENLLQKSRQLGEKLRKRLNGFKERYEIVADARGLGLMLAIGLVKDRESKEPAADEIKAVTKNCFKRAYCC